MQFPIRASKCNPEPPPPPPPNGKGLCTKFNKTPMQIAHKPDGGPICNFSYRPIRNRTSLT